MSSFIRELYDTDFCEVNKYHKLSEEGKSALNRQENICRSLENSLDKENLELFKDYLNEGAVVRSEEIFHAYCCGMRDFIRLVASLFNER